METTMITIKIQPSIKKQAQKLASDMGLTLSGLVKSYLKQIIKTRIVTLSAKEEPTKFLLDILKKTKKEIDTGDISASFDNSKKAVDWLHDSKRKYANKIR